MIVLNLYICVHRCQGTAPPPAIKQQYHLTINHASLTSNAWNNTSRLSFLLHCGVKLQEPTDRRPYHTLMVLQRHPNPSFGVFHYASKTQKPCTTFPQGSFLPELPDSAPLRYLFPPDLASKTQAIEQKIAPAVRIDAAPYCYR